MAASAVGLQTHIWNNNVKSMALLAAYPLIIMALVWVIAAVTSAMLGPQTYVEMDIVNRTTSETQMNAAGAAAFANHILYQYWPAITAVVGIWFAIAYFFNTRMVRGMSKAHTVTRQSEPELYNLLENLCISRGMPMPKLNIIETHARNAFASGIDRRSYTVTVTRGLMNSLQKDELEAVLAHELTHIRNGDVRLLIITIVFTSMVGFAAQLMWNNIRYSLHVPRGRDRKGAGQMMLLYFAILAILWIGYFVTIFTRFAISRKREYLADAGAVELTKNPEAMMRALLRISGRDAIPEATADVKMMCVENSAGFLGIFSTHPPIDKRLKVISEFSGAPIPELTPHQPAARKDRFDYDKSTNNPWLTRERFGRNK